MSKSTTLKDIIRDSLERDNEVNMKAIYRENSRRLGQQRASERQEGGDHYKRMGVEPWDVIDTWPLEQQIGAYRSGALKYIMRMGTKDESPQEIAKGKHYLERLIEVLNQK